MSPNYNYSNSNLAYDLTLFEENKVKSNVLEIPKVKIHKKTLKKTKTIYLRAKVCVFVSFCILAISLIVFNQIQLTELTDKIRIKNEEINAQKSYHTQLECKFNKNYSADVVEDYAKNKLNMQKTDPSKIEYVAFA